MSENPAVHGNQNQPELEPKAHITTRVNGELIGEFMAPLDDPFVRHGVHIGRRDLLRTLLRGRALKVEVTVGANPPGQRRWFGDPPLRRYSSKPTQGIGSDPDA